MTACEFESRVLTAALEYAALGLRVIPLGKNQKRPWMERWPERGSSDPAQIEAWFRPWPESNIGILTGDGLIVLDVDPRNGGTGSFRELTRRRKLPFTARALTGSGGSHYLFRVDPNRLVPNVGGLLPGLDVKGKGGMFVAEPSVHPGTRREYVWLVKPSQGIADAPNWLLKMLPKPKAAPRSAVPLTLTRDGEEGVLLEEAVAKFAVAGPGERNAQMNRVVGSLLGRGYNEELTERVVVAWWHHFHALGLALTPPTGADRVVRQAIDATLRNPDFKRAVGVDHRELCRQIVLEEEQVRIIEQGVILPRDSEGDQGETTPPPCKRVTLTHESGIRLCRSKQERSFVEAILIHFTHKLRNTGEAVLKATYNQFREIVEDRHGLRLENPQLDRLMARYVTRPGREATRFELAVQKVKGRPGSHRNMNLRAFSRSSILRPQEVRWCARTGRWWPRPPRSRGPPGRP